MSILIIVILSIIVYIIGTLIGIFIMLYTDKISSFEEWNALSNGLKFEICGPALLWFIILPIIILIGIAYGVWICSKFVFNKIIKLYFHIISIKRNSDKKKADDKAKKLDLLQTVVPMKPFIPPKTNRKYLKAKMADEYEEW